MKKNFFLFKPAVYIALALYITLTYFILSMGRNVIGAVIPEDHYFEIVGASSLFITSMLFLYGFTIARKSLDKTWFSLVKQLFYLGLAVLFFFGAGEEISWGQRIVGFETPETLSEINRQEEFNLHNLSAWEASQLMDADRLFDLFWFLFAVLTPVVALFVPSFRRFAGKFIPIVFWGVSLLFLYNYVWAKLAKTFFHASYAFENVPFGQAVQEIKESNYAILFILVGLYAIWDLNRIREENLASVQETVEPAFRKRSYRLE